MTIRIRTYDELRAACAELEVLEGYDSLRRSGWDDYGSGQRSLELSRRRAAIRETLEYPRPFAWAEESEEYPPSDDELAAAFHRVGRPRMVRAERDCERYGTRGSRITAGAWRQAQRLYDRERSTDA